MPYLLDTDVLVAANRLHYYPGYCQMFWDWVDAGHKVGAFYSIDKVKSELLAGDETDLLHQWCKRPELDNFFLSSKESTPKWSQLSKWASQGGYLPGALNKFLAVNSADAWLIAQAAASGTDWTVVTNEVAAPQAKKEIKLPDAAAALNVKTLNLSALLRAHAQANFTFVAS